MTTLTTNISRVFLVFTLSVDWTNKRVHKNISLPLGTAGIGSTEEHRGLDVGGFSGMGTISIRGTLIDRSFLKVSHLGEAAKEWALYQS